MQLGFRALGTSEWAGRLPLALAGVLCLLSLFFLLRRLFGPWTGLLGAGVLLGMPAFVLQSRQLTSDIPTQLSGLLAISGLGLACAPVGSSRRLLWLIPGLGGLILGFFSRGAVVGVLLPLLAVSLTLVFSRHLYRASPRAPVQGPGGAPGGGERSSPLSRAFWIQVGLGLLASVALTITAAVLLAGLNPPRYSSFFGETPLVALKVMSYHSVKTPPFQLAVFDVMLKQLAFAAYPWIALAPLGLAYLLDFGRVGSGAGAALHLKGERARLASYGRLLLVCWVLVAMLLGTYWVLRFGDLKFPALPALAGVLAVLLAGLVRERSGRLWMLGLAVAVVVLVLILRDLVEFPEALVSSHINYRLQYPPEVSYKRFMYLLVVAPFAVLTMGLFVGRMERSPVTWPALARRWLIVMQLGVGRWFGLRLEPGEAGESSEPPRVTVTGVIFGLLTIALLMGAGAGAAWAIMKRPTPGGVRLAMVAAPVLLPLLPYLLATALELALFFFEAAWQIASGRLWSGELALAGREDLAGLRDLWRRFFAIHPAFIVLLAPTALLVALVYCARSLARVLILLVLLVLMLPVSIYTAAVARWPSGRLARVGALGAPAVAVGGLVAVGLGLSCYLGWSIIPRLSRHYSYKALLDTYNHSHDRRRPEPLGLYKVRTSSPVFYTKGPLIGEGELRRRYPRAGGASTILQLLEKGWTAADGHHFDRVYAIMPVGELGRLDRDAHARDPAVPYHVLDASNSFYVLVSNRLGKRRVGGRLVPERDQNPLRKMILSEPPRIHCEPGGDMRCVRLSVRLAERKGSGEASLELIGAKVPRSITPGSKFDVILYFKILKRITGKYKVFLHIDGRGSRILGDHDPLGGKYETSLWLPGRWVVDHYTVPASASSSVSTPSGAYRLYAGLFQGDRRMEVLSGPQDGKNRIIITNLLVRQPIGCGGR